MSRRRAAAALTLLAAAAAPPASPAGLAPGIELVASGRGGDDHFGSALAVGDGFAAVGAYLSSAAGTRAGAVYLFRRDAAGNWPCAGVLTGAAGDELGFDLAIDGGQLLIGAPRAHDASRARTGAAYLLNLAAVPGAAPGAACGPLPVPVPLSIPGGRDGDEIGSAVALAGDTLAVGARNDGQAGTGAGSVYLFRQGRLVSKVTPDQPAAGAEFGQSVALSRDGGLLAVGAPLAPLAPLAPPASPADTAGSPAGAAYVFAERDGWAPTRLPGAVRAGDAFGYAMALGVDDDGADQVIVGAPLDHALGTDTGAAYVFRRDGSGGWRLARRLDAGGDARAGAQFGVAVACDRGGLREILAGARRAGGGDRGAAYLFAAGGSALAALASPSPEAGAEFGFSAAVRDGIVVIGAFLQGGGRGAAYLFSPVQGVWVRFAADSVTVRESAGSLRLPLLLTTDDGQPNAAPVTVRLAPPKAAADAPSHFRLRNDHVTIAAGQGGGEVVLDIVPDPLFGDEVFRLGLAEAVGAELASPSIVTITMSDDDPAGLVIALAHPPQLTINDDGAGDSFTVSLVSQPATSVEVSFANAAGQALLAPSRLVFSPADWDRPQKVTVSGVEAAGCTPQSTSGSIAVTTASADARYATLSPPAAPAYQLPVQIRHRDRASIAAILTVAPLADDCVVVYTLVLVNSGECPLEEVAANRLSDVLPWAELSLVTASADAGAVAVDFVANEVRWSGALAAGGGLATITIVAAVQPGLADGQSITNQGRFDYASHPGGPADSTVLTNDPAFPVFALSAACTVQNFNLRSPLDLSAGRYRSVAAGGQPSSSKKGMAASSGWARSAARTATPRAPL